jgi:hypothetical protein
MGNGVWLGESGVEPRCRTRLVEERRFHVRNIGTLVITIALLGLSTLPARAGVAINPAAIDRPDGKGDQVIFYYDARTNFTTFINLNNDGGSDLSVQVLFYGPGFSEPFVQTITLAGGGTTIIDVGALKSATPSALPAQFGVAIATAINDAGKTVVSRALSGNFTVANLQVLSAWGASGAARTAISSEALLRRHTVEEITLSPDLGTVIDGTTVLLPPIQPLNAHLALYYNPEALAPASLGGNQLIFASFEDVSGETYSAASASTDWTVDARSSNGTPITLMADFLVNGVAVSDIVSVVGAGANGSSGSMSFNATTSGAALNRFIFFTETLGTFGTGYLLPPTVSEPLI